MLPQLFQASIVVISNVSQGLIQLCGNFVEAIALKEMEHQSIALVVGQGVEKSLHGRISDQQTDATSAFPALRAWVG